jgi:hypothetical protein
VRSLRFAPEPKRAVQGILRPCGPDKLRLWAKRCLPETLRGGLQRMHTPIFAP